MQITWERVERNINQAKEQLEGSGTEEAFQGREAIISLAQVVFDPNLHTIADGVTPSATDAKRMLEAYLQYELGGSSHEAARRFAKAALDLANDLQHKRTATFRDAALCVEATAAVIRVVALISGHLQGTSRQAIYRKIQSLMPELIAEISTDMKANSLIREFVLVSKQWVMNLRSPCFIYYFEDHDNLASKIQILESQRPPAKPEA